MREYYVQYDEIPMYNFLMIFLTNNYNWLYLNYFEDSEEYNFDFQKNEKKLINHFFSIVGNLNHCNQDLWIEIIHYSGIFHNIVNGKGIYKENIIEFQKTGFKIFEMLIYENVKIENVLNENIDLNTTTLFDWLVIRENTL